MNSQITHGEGREAAELKKAGEGREARDYLTLKEMAQNIGCSYGMIKRDIDLGALPAYRIGRKYFVSTAEAEAYVKNIRKKEGVVGYTIKDLMEMLPLSYAFLVDLIKSKKLYAVKVGRQYVVPKEVFDGFMKDNKIEI
ncbi:MAG: excisionase family DNA-binding protein [Clostridiales bacterium]|nr:excisionase family DNA-binding protein [Clostridiales bacterium]